MRGPRPKLEKWPHAKQVGSGSAQNGPAGRWLSSNVRQGVPASRAPDPDVAQEEMTKPEVATLKSSLEKARAASRCKPDPGPIVATEASISRAQKRLSVLEEERLREQELLDKALLRQERLRRDLQIEREEQPCALPDVSAAPRVGSHCRRLRKERDDLRQKMEGRRSVWMANELPDVDRVPRIPIEEQHIHD